MFKKFTLFIACIACAGMLSASIQIGDLYYNLHDSYSSKDLNGKTVNWSNCAEVISNPSQYAGKIVIPATVEYGGKTYDVKVIGGSAFDGCSNLTAITIPSSIAYVASSAFNSCSSLGAVHISDLKAWCNIYFNNSSSNPLRYAQHLFLNNDELTNITVPEGITTLRYTFYGCSGLISVTLPSTLTSVGYYAFRNTGLTSIVIPEGVTTIDGYAFYSCKSLKSITIPSSINKIDNDVFYSCNALTAVHISDLSKWCQISFNEAYSNPCYYAHHLYLNGEEIIELKLPSDISLLAQYAFYGCSNINSIVIPDNLTNIPSEAFAECYNVKSVSLGANLEYLNQDVFSSFSNLQSVHWNVKNCVDFGKASLSVFYSKRSKISSFTFGESVEHIPAYLCYEMSNLQKIDLPANVKSVGEGAFAFCGRLTEFNAASGSPLYTSIDGVLFSKDKSSLIIFPAGKAATSYTVPSGVQTIEENAFYGCANLSSVTIPASVTSIKAGNSVVPTWSFIGTTPASIAESSFAKDAYLIVDNVDTYKAAWPAYASRIFPREYAEKDLNLSAKSDKSALHMAIGDANLENVIKLTISGTINSYDLMIMRNKMINLRELDLTNASIEANPYEYYTGYCSHKDTLLAHSFRDLRSIKLPKTLKYITEAVNDCNNLKYLEINGGIVGPSMAPSNNLVVVLNEGVTDIRTDAFKEKTTLKKITINAPITEIHNNSFYRCTNLSEVILPATLETIGSGAFQGTSISEITIPSSVKSIGSSAFAPIQECCDFELYLYTHWVEQQYAGEYWDDEKQEYVYKYNNIEYDNVNENYYRYAPILKKLKFGPESKLESIGEYAFLCCPIDTLILPDNVYSIGQSAFAYCTNLKYISLPDNLKFTTLNHGVFQQCNSISYLHLPENLTEIKGRCFAVNSNGSNGYFDLTINYSFDLLIPSKVQTIGQGAFYGRQGSIREVHFPNSLKKIEKEAFSNCTGIKTISFPTSLQTIGDYAFQNCSGLDEIKVPSTLLSVGNYAFSNCSNVTKVYTYTVEPVSIDQNTFSCWKSADLYVPTTSYYTYYYNTQWSQFLSLKQFDEAYEYFYINNDYELGGETGTIDGKPDADLNENSGLIVTGDEEQQVGVITIAGDENGAASIIACEDNLVADSLVIRLITKKGKWSYFCFPFDLLLDQFHFAHQYVIREYNGATRAQYGAGGWINMIGDMIHSGLGYIFQGAQTDTLLITIKNPKISCQDYEQVIQAFSSDEAIHANWNFIGNPYPSWYDLEALFNGGFSSPVYIWNGTDYQVYKPGDDEYHFHPYEGFFTQNPGKNDMHIIWSSNGRETKTQADEKRNGGHMPRKAARDARQEKEQRKLVNLQLASDTYTDRARVVFNENASMDYELGLDAVVMDGGSAPVHLWSTNDGRRLSINERPYGNGQVALGYSVDEDGFYTLSATRMDVPVIIYDNELNQEVDLTQGDYVFSTEAGVNTTRFSIARIKGKEDEATAIDNIIADPNEVVNVYTILGTKVLENVRRSDIKLGAGVYVVENSNGARTEMTVK